MNVWEGCQEYRRRYGTGLSGDRRTSADPLFHRLDTPRFFGFPSRQRCPDAHIGKPKQAFARRT